MDIPQVSSVDEVALGVSGGAVFLQYMFVQPQTVTIGTGPRLRWYRLKQKFYLGHYKKTKSAAPTMDWHIQPIPSGDDVGNPDTDCC